MTIKAIETRYKGYRFRSRLEARWAVFFERLGIEWEYEPQGFEREGLDGDTIRYLPDFRIKFPYSCSYYVEVKGDPDWLRKNTQTVLDTHDFGGILPDFSDCGEHPRINNGLILLGQIPEPKHGQLIVPILGHRKGLSLYWRNFTCDAMHDASWVGYFKARFKGQDYLHDDSSGTDFQSFVVGTTYADLKLGNALAAARSARFEHGEVPV